MNKLIGLLVLVLALLCGVHAFATNAAKADIPAGKIVRSADAGREQ